MQVNPRLQALRAKRDGIQEQMDAIDATIALRADLSPTEDEGTEYEGLRSALAVVTGDIDKFAEDAASRAHTSEILARIVPSDDDRVRISGLRTREPEMTPGQYARLCIRAHAYNDQEAAETLTRALQHETTADTGGLLPVPIFGDLIKFVDANRYAVNVMRNLPMPDKGATFTRPRVTQTTQVGAQAAQGDVLASRKFTVTGDTVTKTTQGGTVALSEQQIDWNEDSMLDLVVQDLAEQYAIDTETIATAAIAAGVTTNNTTLAVDADATAFFAAAGSAAGSLYGTAKALPNVLFASVDRWAYLIGLVDDDGRPLFPNLSPVNAGGTLELGSFRGNPLGVQLAVSPEFSNGFFALGVTKYLEAYERNKGQISIPSPSTLEVVLAYRGYFAAHVRAEGLQGLIDE